MTPSRPDARPSTSTPPRTASSTGRRRASEPGNHGREVEDLEVEGTVVRIVRSSRRTRTISAAWRDGRVQVSVPMGLGAQAERDWARRMLQKVASRQPAGPQSDEDLLARARKLARTWLGGEVDPREVVWSTRQQRRWGSCTPTTGRIRIAAEVARMPGWVLDGVLVHELVHLQHGEHSAAFHAMAGRYPRQKEAMAFLNGVSHATGRGLTGPDGEPDTGEPDTGAGID
ncbi:M48 family metallopeptidase [Citricoccus sp.]|uniref:M48 metallopeptidase family protein n=1 Tax=Citricoccus sp. TaxID=1978372 RepID=UPI0028BEAA89|nr:M48 family metallopeptidase [Citricoccus sp.]